jgi:hypothetical protein
MFPRKSTLELWIEIYSKINAMSRKARKHIISIWHHIMCTSQYGFPTVKNPTLLQKFIDVKDGLIENSQESFKV